MKKAKVLKLPVALAFVGFLIGTSYAALRGGPSAGGEEQMTPSSPTVTDEVVDAAPAEAMPAAPAAEEQPAPVKKSSKKILSGSDGFIAGPDWEFDGFVAGGQGQEIRSMFVANDLLYLNVGKAQEIQPGDRVGIYKRGSRIKDPQTGRFIGYEVRRIAISEVTDKLDEETCSARVIRTNDGIEIGDLVRRDSGR